MTKKKEDQPKTMTDRKRGKKVDKRKAKTRAAQSLTKAEKRNKKAAIAQKGGKIAPERKTAQEKA
ncbi:hypothetical protein PS009_23740, partial [Shigella sonnei]|nr:hypothetical protein [Shigella sonnei]